MKPQIYDTNIVKAALCMLTGKPFKALLCRDLAPLCKPDESPQELGSRLVEEHIAGLEERVRQLTEWLPVETLPGDKMIITLTKFGDVEPAQIPAAFLEETKECGFIIGWRPFPEKPAKTKNEEANREAELLAQVAAQAAQIERLREALGAAPTRKKANR